MKKSLYFLIITSSGDSGNSRGALWSSQDQIKRMSSTWINENVHAPSDLGLLKSWVQKLSSCVPLSLSPLDWLTPFLPWVCLTTQQGRCKAPASWSASAFLLLGFGACVYPPQHCAWQECRPLGGRPACVQSGLWGSGHQAFQGDTSLGTGGYQGWGWTPLIWSPESWGYGVIKYVHFSAKPSGVMMMGGGEYPYLVCVWHTKGKYIRWLHVEEFPAWALGEFLKVILICLCSTPSDSAIPSVQLHGLLL